MLLFNYRFYKDPYKFNPENFSNEAKMHHNPFSYLPFGHGPRNCVGKQFALLELKMVLVKVNHHTI